MSDERKLLFGYNADSGLFNTMADIGHKMFSPETYQCDLCALTHGYFHERKEWKDFIETLDASSEFLHRDEFLKRYPGNRETLPAVFVLYQDGLEICLNKETISQCKELDVLQDMIKNCVS